MTRKEIESQYTVINGIIKSAGKFEQKPVYVPYYWDCFLNGCADRDNGKILGFDVTKEDKLEFPELKHRKTVNIIESDTGFVQEV